MKQFIFILTIMMTHNLVAHDTDTNNPQEDSTLIISEIRGGVLRHDPFGHCVKGKKNRVCEKGFTINAEALFTPLTFSIFNHPITQRPHLGFTLHTAGRTSTAYAGMTWNLFTLWDRLTFDISFGGLIHNGRIRSIKHRQVPLGSRVLFRESFELGLRLSDHWGVAAYLAHASNAELSKINPGTNCVGLRFQYTL